MYLNVRKGGACLRIREDQYLLATKELPGTVPAVAQPVAQNSAVKVVGWFRWVGWFFHACATSRRLQV